MPSAAHSAPAADLTRILAFLGLVAGAVAMGVSPIFVRMADVGPYASAFWRVALALPVLFVWERLEARARAQEGRRDPWITDRSVLAGLFFVGDLFFWHLAIQYTTVANATFFATTMPIWVVLGTFLVFREKIAGATLVGLALALAGGAALLGESLEVNPARLVGDVYGLATAVFFGAYFLAVGRARRDQGAARVTLVSTAVTAVCLLAIALVMEPFILPQSAFGLLMLVALAWVSHAGGQGLLAWALGHLPQTFSSLVIFLEAVAAAGFGWLVLGERLTLLQTLGGVVILLGIWIARPNAGKKPS